MESPVKLLQQLRRRVQSVTYGSPIYRLMLDQGPVPDRVRLSLVDPWPGDAKRGQALIASQPGLFDHEAAAQEQDRRRGLTHDWLRDLRAVGTDLARRKAVALINDWIDEQEGWDDESWALDVLGQRLANWIAFYDFYSPAGSPAFLQRQLTFMARQLRHLLHAAPDHLVGMEGLSVVKGLVFGGLALIEAEKALALALVLLKRQIAEEILPDGGTVFRNPSRQADILRALIDVRLALRAGQLETPHELTLAIVRMLPALKFFRHGDGGLALFHGGREGSPLLLDAAGTLSEARSRVLKRLPQSGFERVTAGRSLLLVDVAPPPPRPFDRQAHAGLLSFEFSVGRERLIVNCGASEDEGGDWRRALAATAAHSAVILGDMNACELLPDGGIGHRPKKTDSQRYEQDGVEYVEASHDGYLARQRVTVKRVLGLSGDGDCLSGREILTGPGGRDFTVRWHLHPSVTALLAQGGDAVLLRSASGMGWRLRVTDGAGGDLGLEPSIYCAAGAPRRTLQIRATGRTRGAVTTLVWTLTRERTKKGT